MQDPRASIMQSMLLLIVFLLLFKSCAFAGEKSDHPFKTPGMICLNENGVWEKI